MDAIALSEKPKDLAIREADPYLAALATWLEGQNINTRRTYLAAWNEFLAFTGKGPGEVDALDVARWKEALKRRGCADATVAQRLSALSSFYNYLQKQGGLFRGNPVDGVGRGDLECTPYGKARKLAVQDFRRILAVIPDTVTGARDRALFLFYVLCARRRNEVVSLRGKDLRWDGSKLMYRVRLKGGKVKWKEMPSPVWEAIKHYLALAGRKLSDESPVFLATTEAGRYLRAYHGKPELNGEKPLTGHAVEQALKRYAARAGLDASKISLHSLRHLGAELFQEASGDIRQTQLFLDHAHLNTTQIYLEQLTGEEHRHWQEMANKLGL